MTTRTVVTGIGIVSPVGLTRDSTWHSLLRGVSGIDRIASFDSEDLETKIAGEVKGFEPTEYMTRKDARRMDRFSQLAIAASQEAVDQAQLDHAGERVSVMVASGIGGIVTLSEQIEVMNEKGPRRVSPFLVPMMLPDMASGHVSMSIGARGPNYSTVSACASGGDAIGQAQLLLRAGAADIVVAGGAEAAVCRIGLAGFISAKALSRRNDEPQRASRPFDAMRDGFVLGEGAAVLVIETLVRQGKRSRFHQWMRQSAKALDVDRKVFKSLTGTIFEVRQGYKSKDSKRQNADIANAATAYTKGYLPCAVILSGQIDGDVLMRYRAEKWSVVTGIIGAENPLLSTYDFMRDVVGYDLAAFFERNSPVICAEMDAVLKALLTPDTR